jgi:O-antigen ligase
MIKFTTAALFFLAAGILTSVSILSGYQVLIVVPMVYYTYLAYKNKQFKLPKSSWILLAFALVAILSIVINYDIIPKPSKNIGRLKYYFYGIACIFVFREWLKNVSDKSKKILVNTYFVSILTAGFYSLYMYLFSGLGRATGLTETMRYGYGSGMMLLIVLGVILHREHFKKWINPQFAMFALLIGFVGMFLTLTRGALLGFLCGLPILLFFYNKKLGLSLGGLALLGVLTLVGIYLFGSGTSNNRYLVNKNNPSDVIRRSQWKAAVIAIREKPVLGWGLSNFHSQLKRIKNDYDLDAKDYDDAHSHNLFLEVGSGTGLVGLILFMSWILMWAYEVYRAGGLVRALVLPFGTAFIVCSQFEVTFDANNASMIFFVYSMSMCFLGKTDSEPLIAHK